MIRDAFCNQQYIQLLHHEVELVTFDVANDFYYSLIFRARETRAQRSEEGAAVCVSLRKTRLSFLRRKTVGIIYDLASGGTYTLRGNGPREYEGRIWVNTLLSGIRVVWRARQRYV